MTNRDNLIEFLLKIVDFDVKLQTNCINVNYNENRKRILLHLAGRCFMVFPYFFNYILFSVSEHQQHETWAEAAKVLLTLINSAICYQMVELIVMIRTRFVILNKQIHSMVESSIKNDISTISDEVVRSKTQFLALSKICSLHHHLSKLIKLFNNTFGVTLLSTFGVNFLVVVTFFFYFIILLRMPKIPWIIVFSTLISYMCYMIDIICLCEVCYSTIGEANKSGELIHKIETEDHDVICEIEMFSLQICNEKVEFTAAGFFPINYTLVFSMIIAAITDLVKYFAGNSKTEVKSQFFALAKICLLHHHLSKLIKLFNDTFGVILLVTFAVIAIKWMYVFSSAFLCTNSIIDTVYVCDVCYSTIEEVKKSGELKHKIETEDHDIIDEIEMIFPHQLHFGVFTIKLLLFHSQIFGLVTFSYTETGFRLSKLRCVYSILLTFTYLSISVYSIHKILLADVPPVFIVSGLTQLSINGTYVAVVWICSLMNHSNFIELLTKMFDFDFKMQSSCILLNYDKKKKRILFQLIARYAKLTVIIALFVFLIFTNPQFRKGMIAVTFQVINFINSAVCYQIVVIVTMIQTRFTILNKQISNLIEYCAPTNASTIDSLITERKVKNQFLTLGRICSLHHHLTKIIKLFNDTFGVTLLLVFTVSFVAIVIPLFYTTSLLQAREIEWGYVFFTIVSSMNFIIDTIYVCEVCYSTIEEVNRSGELIHRIETDDRDVLVEIEMFSLQIANERAEFSAAGFFAINYTLVFSIIGGVTTYIIILIQLSATLVK
ncbi:7tm 7 domain containing protein [Asbolus verrucosus]|uniref:7tm 7 domain containing protein n=1 Tax=Asbolus verrucosus TaxID=1661398 RepID=A0A482V993_ASBVE|nr:7tm 7 domain containing protein [Asbolus verrucosus]